jgi:hypothetical protein
MLDKNQIIDEINIGEWSFWEMHYISLFKSWGFDLTNGDNGGLGIGRHTTEFKNKISKLRKGKSNTWLLGKSKPAEELRNKGLKLRKPIIQINKTTLVEREFDSSKTASIMTGISAGNICSACSGNIKSAGGFLWKYKI